MRHRRLPVDGIDRAVDHQAGGVAGLEDFGLIELRGTVEFDAVEADFLQHAKFFEQRARQIDHAELQRLFDLSRHGGGARRVRRRPTPRGRSLRRKAAAAVPRAVPRNVASTGYRSWSNLGGRIAVRLELRQANASDAEYSGKTCFLPSSCSRKPVASSLSTAARRSRCL